MARVSTIVAAITKEKKKQKNKKKRKKNDKIPSTNRRTSTIEVAAARFGLALLRETATSKRGEDEKVGVPVVAYPAETGLGSNRISYISKQNVADVSCHHLTISGRSQRRDTETRRNEEAEQAGGNTEKRGKRFADASFRRFFNAYENYNVRVWRIPFKTKGTRAVGNVIPLQGQCVVTDSEEADHRRCVRTEMLDILRRNRIFNDDQDAIHALTHARTHAHTQREDDEATGNENGRV